MPELSEIGEFELINRIAEKYDHRKESGEFGIGDDCAGVQESKDICRLFTTDLLIEDIHFLKDKIEPGQLGYKSLAVNFSDIAAMAGNPEYVFISVGFPENITLSWVDEFYSGIDKLATQYSAKLMGGDTTKTPENIVINILVVGEVEKSKIRYRNMAQEGDWICVTGMIGDSAAGLEVLKNNFKRNELNNKLIYRHYNPPVNIDESKFLADFDAVNAMIDLSDGIDSDIQHIMNRSKLGAQIEIDEIPISKSLNTFLDKYDYSKNQLIFGGEDYQILFTLKPNQFDKINNRFKEKFHKSLYKIGDIKDETYGLKFIQEGEETELAEHGYNHFDSDNK